MPKASEKRIRLGRRPNLKNLRLHIFVLGIAIILGGIYFWVDSADRGSLGFGNRSLKIEEVSSTEDKQLGLGGRQRIADDYGMLFVFQDSGKHCFWMKDMHFPIDILWLDESKKVIYIAAHVPPESFPASFCPDKDAIYVLEVQAGLAAKSGVDVGSQL